MVSENPRRFVRPVEDAPSFVAHALCRYREE